MNLYEIAIKTRNNYLKGKYQPGMGWLALRLTYRGELYQVTNTFTNNGNVVWEVYRIDRQGVSKLVLTL